MVLFGFTAPWATLLLLSRSQAGNEELCFGVQVDIPALMHSVFPRFHPPRNPKGVSGWLLSAGRIPRSQAASWSSRWGTVRCRGERWPATSIPRERGHSAMQARSSVFQSYMWKTQEHLKHESAPNISFFLQSYLVLLPKSLFFFPFI